MGLFGFASNIGKKIFGKGDNEAQKLQEHIATNNPGVENLAVEVKDGVATIKGDAKNPEALEKAVLMAGNTLGIEEVKADEITISGQPAQLDQYNNDEEYYIIEKGDSLWKIAEKAYGNGANYNAIFDANREVIEDPNKIFPGQKIRIPKNI